MADTVENQAQTTAGEVDKPIFDDVYFAVIPSKKLSDEKIAKLTSDLQSHGATHCPLSSTALRQVTHLISSTSDFPAFHDAVDAFIHVVKPLWVEQSILKKRSLNPRQYSPDPKLFLSDVILTFADDIPQGDKDAIMGGLTAMGGQYSAVLTKLVTHIVALSNDNSTCRVALDKKLSAKPVLPHWFDDCLKLGKKIGHEPYMLPDPPILSTVAGPRLTYFTSSAAIADASRLEHPEEVKEYTIPVSPSKERKELAVLRNKNVMLHQDLKLSERLTGSLSQIIRRAGGEITSQLDDADILVCRYRESSECIRAIDAGIDVGNLSWLYYLINHNTWTDPMRRLLHFPFPRDGIEGIKGQNIAVSNYTGEARVYVESLIKAAKGEYTKTMSQLNTHLITAHIMSEKCDAAKEWGINLINHLWLEESYSKWKVQAVTNARYNTFPKQTNLCEVVGQTPIDRDAVYAKLFPGTPRATAGQAEEADDAEDSTLTRTPAAKQAKLKSVQKSIETPLPSRLKSQAIQTPGSRGAKDRALNKLHSMAPDIALFEKERKRVGGVIYGGRRVTDPDRISLHAGPGRKRSSSAAEIVVVEEAIEKQEPTATADSEPLKKKPKNSRAKPTADLSLPPPSEPRIKVLLTGVEKDNNNLTHHFKSNLRGLNIAIVDEATHDLAVIVAPRILRTKKFLLGIAAGSVVVRPQWLEDMAAEQRRLPPEDYLLRDDEYEADTHFDLERALQRARKHKAMGGMLKGWTIFCTENVKGGFSTFEEIIKVNGGKCLLFKGRETTVPRSKDRDKENIAEDWMMVDGESPTGQERKAEEDFLYLITDEKDSTLWAKYTNMATSQGFTPRVVRPDWLLRVAQTQVTEDWSVEWDYLA